MDTNNASFFDAASYPEILLAKFRLWCDFRNEEPTMERLAKFAGFRPSTALDYAVGEVVTVKWNEKDAYGRVVRYGCSDSYYKDYVNVIYVDVRGEYPDGASFRCYESERGCFKARIPEELMELAKSELLKSVRCPLAEARNGGEEVAK